MSFTEISTQLGDVELNEQTDIVERAKDLGYSVFRSSERLSQINSLEPQSSLAIWKPGSMPSGLNLKKIDDALGHVYGEDPKADTEAPSILEEIKKGSQSRVFKVLGVPDVLVKAQSYDIQSIDLRFPYTKLVVLQAEIERDLKKEMEKLNISFPLTYFASQSVIFTEEVSHDTDFQDSHRERIRGFYMKLYEYIESRKKELDPLWDGVFTDFIDMDAGIIEKDFFIDENNKIILVDPFLYYREDDKRELKALRETMAYKACKELYEINTH